MIAHVRPSTHTSVWPTGSILRAAHTLSPGPLVSWGRRRRGSQRPATVAIGTPNLAVGSLCLEPPQTTASPRQIGQVGCLGADVVKVQYDEPRIAAIDTPRAIQQLPEVGSVPALARGEMTHVIETLRIEAPGSSCFSGPQTVAVGAQDSAVLDLTLKSPC